MFHVYLFVFINWDIILCIAINILAKTKIKSPNTKLFYLCKLMHHEHIHLDHQFLIIKKVKKIEIKKKTNQYYVSNIYIYGGAQMFFSCVSRYNYFIYIFYNK